MKNKFLLFNIFIITIFSSCNSSFIQVFETNSENVSNENNTSYTYENDSITVIYNFWENNGKMSFAVYNKLKKPLYIDWKKSSYISNSVKINYWEDIVTTNSVESRQTIIDNRKYNNGYNIKNYYVSNSIGVSSSSSSKPEKITFIPPKSNYFRTQFKLLPINELKVKEYNIVEVPNLNNNLKSDKIFEKNLSKSQSPLIFRNFITMSYTEDFSTEFYVDNEFYISKVIKLKSNQFEAIKRKDNSAFFEKSEDGKLIKMNPYKSEKSFYVKIK